MEFKQLRESREGEEEKQDRETREGTVKPPKGELLCG